MPNTEKDIEGLTKIQADNIKETAFGFLHGDERAMLFIDGSNTYHAVRLLDKGEIDFKSLQTTINDYCRLIDSKYYITLPQNQNDYSAVRHLIDWLSYNGYNTQIRYVEKQNSDPNTNNTIICDMVVDIMEAIYRSRIEVVFILSGNSGFTKVVEKCKEAGVIVVVISTISSPNSGITADKLRRAVSKFIDWADLLPVIKTVNRSERRQNYDTLEKEQVP